MAIHRNDVIEGQTVILDGSELIDCELRQCTLVYKAQEPVKLDRCHLVGCTWQFEDAALRTVSLLKGLYLAGPPGKEIIEAIFRQA
jgi:hypothetical protein